MIGEQGDKDSRDQMADVARRASLRAAEGQANPEPSLGARFGQIGVLGWTVVGPTLLGLLTGRWLDRHFATGIFFSAPMVMAGAALGFWFAWKWMHRQL